MVGFSFRVVAPLARPHGPWLVQTRGRDDAEGLYRPVFPHPSGIPARDFSSPAPNLLKRSWAPLAFCGSLMFHQRGCISRISASPGGGPFSFLGVGFLGLDRPVGRMVVSRHPCIEHRPAITHRALQLDVSRT